ncbi:hypothetical protein D3C81_305010 [compost metagenome]
MAGTIPLEQLFLNKFVEVNLARYENDAEMLPLFQNLTLSEITISDLVPGVPEQQTATVTSVSRNFRGVTQQWLPAFLNSPNAFVLKNKDTPLANAAALADQTTPGAYVYTDGADTKVGLVLSASSTSGTQQEDVKAVFQDAYRYIISSDELTTDTTTITVAMNAYTRGSLVYAIGSEPVKVIPPTDYGRLEYPEPAE